jgi:ectoine hydroxylase-related dioxygenase (phytanoyl-CoA dioxygenase family)
MMQEMIMLSQEQVDFYHDQGYLLVKGLLTHEEAARLRAEAHGIIERLSAIKDMEATWGSARGLTTQKTVLLHCHNAQFFSAGFSRLLVDERLTGAAAQLIGSPNVQLHHNKIFIKPPEKGAPFPMHQDQPFFPHANHSMIAAIVHFDDAPIEKGCVRVVPGSHKLGPLEHRPEGGYHLSFEEYPLESATPCPAAAGDALFFSYLTIHGSGVNVSQEARTTILIQMRDPEDQPLSKVGERGEGMLLRGYNPAAQPQDAYTM